LWKAATFLIGLSAIHVEADDALLELPGIGKRLFPGLSKIYHHERGTNQQVTLHTKKLRGSSNPFPESWTKHLTVGAKLIGSCATQRFRKMTSKKNLIGTD
jgi:hypothetical protein